jgi:hypothetical protein
MPYTIVERNDKHCVYKKDETGNPTGESLGCHPTMEKAQEQMKALYANMPEGDPSSLRSSG